MHLGETSHWLWTCKAWERVKCGSTAKASEGTGRLMLKVAAVLAVTLVHSGPQSVRLVVEDQLKDGIVILALHPLKT